MISMESCRWGRNIRTCRKSHSSAVLPRRDKPQVHPLHRRGKRLFRSYSILRKRRLPVKRQVLRQISARLRRLRITVIRTARLSNQAKSALGISRYPVCHQLILLRCIFHFVRSFDFWLLWLKLDCGFSLIDDAMIKRLLAQVTTPAVADHKPHIRIAKQFRCAL